MLSYQHGYHAGNVADVHKHVVLTLLLTYLQRKPSPFAVLDLYAGRGLYDLHDASARKTEEAQAGILRLTGAHAWPALLAPYASALKQVNDVPVLPGVPRWYPGSPLIARLLCPETCPVVLNELHPAEHAALSRVFQRHTAVHLHRRDALEALPALVPPPQKRGLVVLDPSYERVAEYDAMAAALGRALQRWSNGVYLLWYPLLADHRHRPMIRQLRNVAGDDRVLQSELRVRAPGAGMHGSGVLVINPPWVLADELGSLAGWFAPLCEPDSGGLTRVNAAD